MSPLSKSSLEMIKYGASVNRQEDLRIEFRDGVGELLAGVSVWYSNTPTYNGLWAVGKTWSVMCVTRGTTTTIYGSRSTSN